ncbi:MAG: glycosyltransferase family 2 protein [Flavobacteriales bacterium]|nr:glycosyltransferase family 2 protein [Flavobacteriales bacterium]
MPNFSPKISGFSYVRNGFDMGYPFIESIKSVLAICDEFVMAVGDSTDGTREAIEALDSDKIKIVDTVWDLENRKGGLIFADQSNAALEKCTGDWIIHVQADELFHENNIELIRQEILRNNLNHEVEGFLFPFLNFYGSYDVIRTSRKAHRFETRVFRNNQTIFAYKDSQGFRKYTSKASFLSGEEKGEKLHVKKLTYSVYHYTKVRSPRGMSKKSNFFMKFWHQDEELKDRIHQPEFDYYAIDRVEKYVGPHPQLMRENIENQDWKFDLKKVRSNMSSKHKFLHFVEDITGYRLFEYKNYKLLK